jgi:hypothetical protein
MHAPMIRKGVNQKSALKTSAEFYNQTWDGVIWTLCVAIIPSSTNVSLDGPNMVFLKKYGIRSMGVQVCYSFFVFSFHRKLSFNPRTNKKKQLDGLLS